MLRGNLSTRPFINDRLASLAIAGIAVVVVLLSGFNVWRLTVLTSQRSDVLARLEADEREVARVEAAAAALRESVDRPTLSRLAGSAREANALIGQRTFSWTTLFGLLEKTLPTDVRLVAVSPRVEQGTFKVALKVIARDFEDIDDFIEALRDTGMFYDVAPVEQDRNEDDTYVALIEAAYLQPTMARAEPTTAHASGVPVSPGTAAPVGGRP